MIELECIDLDEDNNITLKRHKVVIDEESYRSQSYHELQEKLLMKLCYSEVMQFLFKEEANTKKKKHQQVVEAKDIMH